MKHVVIQVLGGVAYVEYKSPGVEVTIVDIDNLKEEGIHKNPAAVLESVIDRVRKLGKKG